MIAAGYMAKRIMRRPDWLKSDAVEDIYSVSGCMSADFAEFIPYWEHNGFWFFDSINAIRALATAQALPLDGCRYFYYEAFELEYDGDPHSWHPFGPAPTIPTAVEQNVDGVLEGYDVVSFSAGSSAECSPLSCNGLAAEMPTNRHCLFPTFEEAKACLEGGGFAGSEPGPYRIYAVYSIDPDPAGGRPQAPARACS